MKNGRKNIVSKCVCVTIAYDKIHEFFSQRLDTV